MEAGLMEIVRSLNRSLIYDSNFSVNRPTCIHLGEMYGVQVSNYPLFQITPSSLKPVSSYRGGNLRPISNYPLRFHITPYRELANMRSQLLLQRNIPPETQ